MESAGFAIDPDLLCLNPVYAIDVFDKLVDEWLDRMVKTGKMPTAIIACDFGMTLTTLGALLFAGLIGSGIAYFLWFEIVRRLPAMTASLGVLSAPVVGVVGAVVLLGERPTLPDIVGFALILAASGCVLLAPGTPASVTEPT